MGSWFSLNTSVSTRSGPEGSSQSTRCVWRVSARAPHLPWLGNWRHQYNLMRTEKEKRCTSLPPRPTVLSVLISPDAGTVFFHSYFRVKNIASLISQLVSSITRKLCMVSLVHLWRYHGIPWDAGNVCSYGQRERYISHLPARKREKNYTLGDPSSCPTVPQSRVGQLGSWTKCRGVEG